MTQNEIETAKAKIKLAFLTHELGELIMKEAGWDVKMLLSSLDQFLAVLDDMKDKPVIRTIEPPLPEPRPNPFDRPRVRYDSDPVVMQSLDTEK